MDSLSPAPGAETAHPGPGGGGILPLFDGHRWRRIRFKGVGGQEYWVTDTTSPRARIIGDADLWHWSVWRSVPSAHFPTGMTKHLVGSGVATTRLEAAQKAAGCV